MSSEHIPVLLDETLHWLLGSGGKRFIDCTINGGGHSRELLNRGGDEIKLLGIDRDPAAMEACGTLFAGDGRVTLLQGNFDHIIPLAERWGYTPVDGILSDFGMSSNQLNRPRGFSFRGGESLDMRYDPSSGITAEQLLNDRSETELHEIIARYGEERNARRIAKAIVAARPIRTATQLTSVITAVVSKRFAEKSLARVFQSFRVAVNDDLGSIERLLPAALKLLAPGGRMVLLSYNSLEDSIVKRFIRDRARGCICPPHIPKCICNHKPEVVELTPKVVRPTAQEISLNPRSRSARLRVAEKLTP